jgi:predicted amidophosphoribosyltransferase
LDLLVPILIIGVAAVLTVIISAVLAVMLRRRKTMPTMNMICPRCRMPISPYDTFCRNCGTPLYQGYMYYPRRR